MASAGNSVKGDGGSNGFRFTGDLDTKSKCNGTNVAYNMGTGLSNQTCTIGNNLVGYAVSDCQFGYAIPNNTTLADGTATGNIVEYTAIDCVYGATIFNTQYQWVRSIISNASFAGFEEYDTTGAGGIGDLKSNKFDLLVHDSRSGAILESSFNEINITTSQILNEALIINGSHNIIKLVSDLPNTFGAASSRGLRLNGSYNIVDVVSVGNPAAIDVTIAGNSNVVRVITDKQVEISGDKNIVDGYAGSVNNTGTGNVTSRLGVY